LNYKNSRKKRGESLPQMNQKSIYYFWRKGGTNFSRRRRNPGD
jgi:hypothetical protein